ncbi:pirin family protein [Geminocystis sp. GBBB08]|uniref:pirin family protein n=1 Tax=Geminocystis sp. GBBB08 TaxID=2604140 RepID=UPI0027E2270F|nr:pirin family protein [Geminocystis sp. GBBB08]MBL1208306.1 pirin family protein [Geminocystis sp. GBBB08]
MITIRPSAERGNLNFGWLDTKHTFSFGSYYDPKYTGFGNLLVINEDIIAPGQGFGTHGHQDMEIVTYVIEGELEHKDSIGNIATIPQGEVQRMTAGTGIRHSEYNHSQEKSVHLLQIWITPNTKDLTPSYEQKSFSQAEKQDKLCLLASNDGRKNSLKIHQNVDLFGCILGNDKTINYQLKNNDYSWIQIVKGELNVNEKILKTGDGLAIKEENKLILKSFQENTEFLLFHFQ